jgi:pyrimidine and pyridine-specific 5'-nucleotidase
MLHFKYYREYGLAIEGLVRHHKVDPLEYNRKVDDALPLDDVITPDPQLRELLEDLDQTKVKPWLFTNAYINHGKRVVKLLGVDDLFEGITYCDYGATPLLCKPAKEQFDKAEAEAGAPSTDQCYFVGMLSVAGNLCSMLTLLDDSDLNCAHAYMRGWNAVHLLEPGDKEPPVMRYKHRISSLQELRDIFPQFFKSKAASTANGEMNGHV